LGLKRFNELKGVPEITELEEGMDFRNPLVRREVFLDFYGFHLKYKSHPGAVYYVMPYLAEKYGWDFETKLWFAFINGATQNPLTSWVIFEHFPSCKGTTPEEMETWHRQYWRNLDYDIDRRYQKGHFVEMYENYLELLGDKTQEEYFHDICDSESEYENFTKLWDVVFNDFFMYGRLSTFSYLEYLKIMGLNIDCDNLFIYDKSGSKSHRNGLCVVMGRDDLDVRKDNENLPAELEEGHNKEVMAWLEKEGEILLMDAKERFEGEPFFEDVNYFTLESTLCCYKSWHRKNRRYPNVYNDMFYDRIKKAETRDWKEIDGSDINFDDFWEARKSYLPKELRREDNPDDPGLVKVKQNWYRNTGEVIMMDIYKPVYKNNFFSDYRAKEIEWYGKPSKKKEVVSAPKVSDTMAEWL
jgi:hypothetical protein